MDWVGYGWVWISVRGYSMSIALRSQILQLTKSVGGTNAPRADNFSSEAPGAFNMHFSPILAYFFGQVGMSSPTFALSNPV